MRRVQNLTTICVTHRFWYGNFCQKYYGLPSSTLFTESGTVRLLAFPKVKMTMKDKHFESIQDIEVTTSATKDTHERGLPELLQKVARTMG